MATLLETVLIDALLLLSVIICIYLTYNASVRLSLLKAKRWMIAGLRVATVAEVIILVYALVDIPWTIGRMYYPQLNNLLVLEFLFIYVIVTAMIAIPAVGALLRVSLDRREATLKKLTAEREELLKQVQLATAKYLRKQISEIVFTKVSTDLQSRLLAVEAKLEKLRVSDHSSIFGA